MKQNLNQLRSSRWVIAVGFAALTAVGCAGGPLSAREKGAGFGEENTCRVVEISDVVFAEAANGALDSKGFRFAEKVA